MGPGDAGLLAGGRTVEVPPTAGGSAVPTAMPETEAFARFVSLHFPVAPSQ